MGSILSMQWPVPASKRPNAVLVVSGVLHQMRGRLSVLRGSIFHNDILRAQGHRQQLVGMLQRFWKRDRGTIEAWVDAALRKNVVPPSMRKPSWRGRLRTGAQIMQRET
jgi:uncharacterized protein YjbJ (UPF0337 family)